MRVMKFGEGCLKNSNDFQKVAQIIKSKKDNLVVVVSAIYGVTNLLEQAMKMAFVSEIEIDKTIEKIRQVHLAISDEILNCELKNWVKSEIDFKIEKLKKNLYGICWTSEVTDSIRAMIFSYGERFSTYLLAGVLKNEGRRILLFDKKKETYEDLIKNEILIDLSGNHSLPFDY